MNPEDYRYHVEKLPNGLRLAWLHVPHARNVHFTALVRGGCLYETKENNGVSHLLEHLHMSTSKKYPTREAMTEAIGRMGSANASTSQDYLHFEIGALPRFVQSAAELLAEILSPREFDSGDIELERALVLDEIRLDGSQSGSDPFVEFLYQKEGPLKTVCGTVQSVRALDETGIQQFDRAAFRPEHMVVGVAGELNKEIVSVIVEALTDNCSVDREEFVARKVEARSLPMTGYSSAAAGSNGICLGFLHPGLLRGPDWVSVGCLDRGLFSPPSPLFNQLRYGKTNSYNIGCRTTSYFRDVSLQVLAYARPRDRRLIIDEVLSTLESIRRGTMSKTWFSAMHHSTAYALSSSLSNLEWLSWHIAQGEFYFAEGGGVGFAEEIDALNNLTLDQFQDFARRLFRPENAFILLGSRSWRCAPRHIRGMIEKYLG